MSGDLLIPVVPDIQYALNCAKMRQTVLFLIGKIGFVT